MIVKAPGASDNPSVVNKGGLHGGQFWTLHQKHHKMRALKNSARNALRSYWSPYCFFPTHAGGLQ